MRHSGNSTRGARRPRTRALVVQALALIVVAASVASAAPGAASPGDILLCSSGAGGAQGDKASTTSRVSGDGRYVVFESDADNLVGPITNIQVLRKDTVTGQVALCSANSSGVPADDNCLEPCISDDGRYVAFVSNADNLLGTSCWDQVYRKDMSTGQVVLCSSSTGGTPGGDASSEPSISAEGRYVAFESVADNFGAPTAVYQVYRKDLSGGQLYCCSTSAGGARGDHDCTSPAMTPDGRYVAFDSPSDNLVSPVSAGQVFRKDASSGAILFCSTNASGAQAGEFAYGARISANGRFVAFSSAADNLVNPSASHQIYRKDLSSGGIALCSASASGAQGDNKSYPGAISHDGRFVVFDSNSDNLVSPVTDGQVFRKDMKTGRILFCSATGAGVVADSSSDNSDTSADGRFVAFRTDADNLVHASTVNQVYRKELSLPVPEITSISPGSGGPGSEVTIRGHNFRSLQFGSFVTFGGRRATAYSSWSDTEIKARVPEGGYGTVDVIVTTGGGESNPQEFTYANSTWYLAEGSTAWGYSTYVTIMNPNTSAAHAKVTYNTDSGPVPGGTVTLPAGSQATVNPADVLGEKDFSTKVVCTEGRALAVDRTMTWTGQGAYSPEAHNSVGVTSPAKRWYLPEGSSAWGFECWLLIQNPNAGEATCTVTYMLEGEGPKSFEKKVPASSRKSYNMADDIGSRDASIKVESNLPVIPERAMYRNARREGHDSIGTTSPAHDYYLAEGTTAWGFTTYVLIQNPGSSEATVNLTYMTDTGAVPHPQNPITMPPSSRRTVRVNDFLTEKDFSTRVQGSKPIIAERAMYWNGGSGEACHDSIGMSSPHKTFYFPDGQNGGGYQTYTLVQNPNSSDVSVELRYLTPNGAGNVVKTEKIPADSRRTFELGGHSGLTGRAAITVRCTTAGKKIMCERAMYWNSRGAGTDTIGGFLE